MSNTIKDWNQIEKKILRRSPRNEMAISKKSVIHPIEDGYRKSSINQPKGQKADYRKSLSDGRGLHIREYEDKYKIHWDKKDPIKDPIRHLKEDAPEWLIGITVAGGIGAGLIFNKFR